MGLFSGPWQSKEEHERGVHLNLISRVNSLELIAYEQGAKLQVAQGRVEELEGELKCAQDLTMKYWDFIKKDYARIAELEAVLKPFAYDYGDYSDGMWSDLDYIQVSVGDLRAARAAMEGK